MAKTAAIPFASMKITDYMIECTGTHQLSWRMRSGQANKQGTSHMQRGWLRLPAASRSEEATCHHDARLERRLRGTQGRTCYRQGRERALGCCRAPVLVLAAGIAGVTSRRARGPGWCCWYWPATREVLQAALARRGRQQRSASPEPASSEAARFQWHRQRHPSRRRALTVAGWQGPSAPQPGLPSV